MVPARRSAEGRGPPERPASRGSAPPDRADRSPERTAAARPRALTAPPRGQGAPGTAPPPPTVRRPAPRRGRWSDQARQPEPPEPSAAKPLDVHIDELKQKYLDYIKEYFNLLDEGKSERDLQILYNKFIDQYFEYIIEKSIEMRAGVGKPGEGEGLKRSTGKYFDPHTLKKLQREDEGDEGGEEGEGEEGEDEEGEEY